MKCQYLWVLVIVHSTLARHLKRWPNPDTTLARNLRRWANADTTLARHLTRWANADTTLARHLTRCPILIQHWPGI